MKEEELRREARSARSTALPHLGQPSVTHSAWHWRCVAAIGLSDTNAQAASLCMQVALANTHLPEPFIFLDHLRQWGVT